MARHFLPLPPPHLSPAAILSCASLLLALIIVLMPRSSTPAPLQASTAIQAAVHEFQACIARDIAAGSESGCELALEPAIEAGVVLALAPRQTRQRAPRPRAQADRNRGGGATQRALALPFFSFRS